MGIMTACADGAPNEGVVKWNCQILEPSHCFSHWLWEICSASFLLRSLSEDTEMMDSVCVRVRVRVCACVCVCVSWYLKPRPR